MGQPALVTRDVLAVLDDAGVRCEVVETDANYTTLRFDHLALDDLAKAVANVDWDDCPKCSEKGDEIVDLNGEIVGLEAKLAKFDDLLDEVRGLVALFEAVS